MNYLNRRNFLKITGITTSLSLLPDLSFGQNDEVIMGHNTHKYRVVPGWGILDAGKNPVNDCHEMVEDAKGRLILLTNEIKNNVLIYDKSGKLLESWGNSYPGGHGLTLFNEGAEQFLLICDTDRHQVIKTDLKGKEIFKIEYPKETGKYDYPTQFKPTETAVNPLNGDIYVVDGYGLNYVVQYDSKGKYIRHWGGYGDENGQFKCNHGVVVDLRNPQKPTLIVTSRIDNCWKRFTLDGKYLSTIPLPGTFICRPVIKGDYLYGAAYRSTQGDYPNSGYLQILDKNDKVVSSPGASEPTFTDGKLLEQRKLDPAKIFMHPHDVCVDSDQNLYVAQWASKKTYPVKLERIA
ncbi:6-bladed beta-propeller [Emticicia sp. CRIBPO]|uniref:6-bladed beta-propeller n=1 Tax=Emticicia sp. CRIBPO TaxID=2683258 RepID=UPI00141294EF|nr:6-bladed beta-propeller [Emticicia sp. CRIBPO]NBA85306.1 6-bladed beta-propeller [Emticicia sp. CRIBPO]